MANNEITIILPFRLPTWNQILAMPLRQRMKVKKWIREFVSTSIQDAGGSLIPMGCILRPRLTDYDKAVYLSMIRPDMSRRSRIPRRFRRGRKR